MELFREDGCLTDAGLCALREGKLDELGRLEAAEHLAYCDGCMDRYTALLTADVLETPPRSVRGTVMTAIWVKLMQNTYGRIAVAGVAAVLALSMWRSGGTGAGLGLPCRLPCDVVRRIHLPSAGRDGRPRRCAARQARAGALPEVFRRAEKSAARPKGRWGRDAHRPILRM